MCGITGIFSLNEYGLKNIQRVKNATKKLEQRGPDFSDVYINEYMGLGHTRLSIIDTSNEARQPFIDASGRYVVVYNGELYNFKELKKDLLQKGYNFKSTSDTEVLLYSYIEYGSSAISMFNGFFSFAIYDLEEKSLFLARDRMGIKPLYYYEDNNQFIFGSELKAIFEYDIPRELSYQALSYYLQLAYIPAPYSILKNCYKLEPGYQLYVTNKGVKKEKYFEITYSQSNNYRDSYENAQKDLKNLIYKSVEKRMVADVPLGSFLSGGLDSSVIAGVANEIKPGLKTFSIGYENNPHFDETEFANIAAKSFGSDHTVYKLNNKDFSDNLGEIIDYIDEPFADSSSIAVYILSKKVSAQVRVALSGDGADELFAGYNKHYAEYNSRKKNLLNALLTNGKYLLDHLPQSRNSKTGNLFRQIARYSEGLNLNPDDRYWRWASVMSLKSSNNFLREEINNVLETDVNSSYKKWLNQTGNFNDVLFFDTKLVLPDDMLTKVDRMSMANGLEVRTPFLDHHIVDFVFSLPTEFKITNNERKKILKDTFKFLLPKELLVRKKKGFEVPLNDWIKGVLSSEIEALVFNRDFIKDQGIFNFDYLIELKKRYHSNYPGDAPTLVWLFFIFQTCWRKHFFK